MTRSASLASGSCLLALVLAAGALPGCGSGGSTTTTATKPASAETKPAQSAGAPNATPPARSSASLVSSSELRERALEVIEDGSRSSAAEVRANAVEAAGLAARRCESVIASGLKDDNVAVRSVAAMAAGRAKVEALAPALNPMLLDSSQFVRAAAVMGLARMGKPVDQTPLSTMLLTDSSPRVRAHAAFCLGEIGNRSALGLLRQAARSSVPRASDTEIKLMQLQVSEAMVKLGDDETVQSIRAALYPSRPEELEATALAVQILGQVRDKGSSGAMIHLAETKDAAGRPLPAEIRLGIAGSLAKLGSPQGGFIADEFVSDQNPLLRAQSAAVYGEIGDQASLARLSAMLGDPDERVRISAARGVLTALSGGRASAK
ncbi:MAG: HEAT repeat domain-containing protein [Phycisphaerales bacterium]|nr:HEAT repeat domain-containing protein [Phycisphaerales bacterium]